MGDPVVQLLVVLALCTLLVALFVWWFSSEDRKRPK